MPGRPISEQIYLSRDSIREQISSEVQNYLELANVDLTKSSFLSFMIDTVSTLTGNLLFYQLSTYREFFLTKAQLPESILNLSSFLGYNTKEATPARVNVLMEIPLTFDDPSVQFNIPVGFVFRSDTIEFRTYYSTTIIITNNASANIQVLDGNKRYILPYTIEDGQLSFVLPLQQLKEVVQEFQIDSDIQQYQFITLDVPVTGEIASLRVELQQPDSPGYTLWTEFDSLFLMSATDKGYVSRRTDSGRRLTFGNGLIGEQPIPGSQVLVTIQTTEGEDGNVIAGSIADGQRIYYQALSGINQVIQYNVINTSPAFGGKNEESLEEIRKNAIASITSLNRLVTENDYKNINLIVPESPIAQNSLPVLKRSDLQVNEISLFSGILFGGDDELNSLVPTRNAVISPDPADSTSFNVSIPLIPRGKQVTIGDSIYYTMFDILIDVINTVGNYEYILYELELLPALETSFSSTYDLYADQLEIIRDGDKGVFKLYYKSTEPDSHLATCTLTIASSGSEHYMLNDSTNGYFVYTFDPYTDIPAGEQSFNFTIQDPSMNNVGQYVNKLTFRNDLSSFMRSNVKLEDSTAIIVYDVPVVEKTYYDSVNKRDFELEVLQKLISSVDLTDSRMLTDFTNIKFTNTHGLLENMKLNEATISPVIDIIQTLPVGCTLGNRFIYAPTSGNDQHQDFIIKCIDSTANLFSFEAPISDSIVYITNRDENYIYSERGWIQLPVYKIPFEIDIEVFRSETFSGTITALINTVKETLYNEFKDRFGTNVEIYRSEIIEVVHNIEGVSHCRLRKPETSIFFNFKLKNFTQEQLLRYGPEFVYFTEDSITVRVI